MKQPRPVSKAPVAHRLRDRAYRLRHRARPLTRAETAWLVRYDATVAAKRVRRLRAPKEHPRTARMEAIAIATWAADYIAPDESPHPIFAEWKRRSVAGHEGYARAGTEWAEPVAFDPESAEEPDPLPIGNQSQRNANIQVLIEREDTKTGQAWSSCVPLTRKWDSLHTSLFNELKKLFDRYRDAGALLGVSVQVSPQPRR